MLDPKASRTPGSFYSAHLQSLRDFARELQAQLDAVSRGTGQLDERTAAAVALGDFTEANTLRDRHAAAVAETRALLERVLAAISFAERVTDTVADSYAEADGAAAKSLGRAVNT